MRSVGLHSTSGSEKEGIKDMRRKLHHWSHISHAHFHESAYFFVYLMVIPMHYDINSRKT